MASVYCIKQTLKLSDNKLKKKIYHVIRSVPKSNRKIVESGKMDTTNTQIHKFPGLVQELKK
jgi:hypothetical protein